MNTRDQAHLLVAAAVAAAAVALVAGGTFRRATAHADTQIGNLVSGYEANAGGDVRWTDATPGAGHGAHWTQLHDSIGRRHPIYRSLRPGSCRGRLIEKGWQDWIANPPSEEGVTGS